MMSLITPKFDVGNGGHLGFMAQFSLSRAYLNHVGPLDHL